MAGKLLITGAAGQLGQALIQAGARQDWAVAATDLPELDITDPQAVWGELSRQHPEVVINTAAATRVDDLESNPDEALRVNGLGPRNLAVACRRLGMKIDSPVHRLCLRRGQTGPLWNGTPRAPVGLWPKQAVGGRVGAAAVPGPLHRAHGLALWAPRPQFRHRHSGPGPRSGPRRGAARRCRISGGPPPAPWLWRRSF